MTTTPYRPANATEGDAFERRWCAHCIHEKGEDWEDEFGNDVAGLCDVLQFAARGAQPVCWTIKNGVPWCSEFVEDKTNTARCLFTKEMEI